MRVIYMSEKRILPDTLIHKILSKYGDYNYLPIFDTSTEIPINTNTYDKIKQEVVQTFKFYKNK